MERADTSGQSPRPHAFQKEATMAAKGSGDALLSALEDAEEARFQLSIEGNTLSDSMLARRFSTGSAGFRWQGKVGGANGRRYQVQVQAVVIGSKE